MSFLFFEGEGGKGVRIWGRLGGWFLKFGIHLFWHSFFLVGGYGQTKRKGSGYLGLVYLNIK